METKTNNQNYSHKESMKVLYNKCNSTLPKVLPACTYEEALKAHKLLVRKFGLKRNASWRPYLKAMSPKYKPRKCWVALSGDVSSLDRGWRRLIHDTSHNVFDYRHPRIHFSHSAKQAELELEMINYVKSSGWLEGSLKSQVLSKEEKKFEKVEHFKKLLNKWEAKQKFASTFVKKYKQRLKRLSN